MSETTKNRLFVHRLTDPRSKMILAISIGSEEVVSDVQKRLIERELLIDSNVIEGFTLPISREQK